ncbi:hypothetical protein CH302_00980 [Rhodococcus sp. 15-2388-1-1a]|uniref:zinc finger domain-containing protein n=1 Tax=Nocardiaceae TaxID=85025 RepID=UPI000560A38F|nr:MULTISPECIES: hypothetical protein [Rhodococcus]OZF05228.1 hypothetical protein CH302_00980 [Rhodococcus sp. 15-2388-1-1a]
MRNPDFDQLTEKQLAETIPCRGCGAPKGEPCFTVGRDGQRHPLTNFPAHLTRTKRAQRLQRMAEEENLTMTDDGLFQLAEPEWADVPVNDLVTPVHRGRTMALEGIEVRFTGTHHGADDDGRYVVVHGTDATGHSRSKQFRIGATVAVKAKQ